MKKILSFLLLTFTITFVDGQNSKIIQLKFSSGQYPSPVTYIDCDSGGLCVLYRTPAVTTDTNIWHILYYDTLFNLIHQTAFKLTSTQTYIGADYDRGNVMILFRNKINRKRNYTGCVAHYNIYDRQIGIEAVEDLPDSPIRRFSVCDRHLLFICQWGDGTENLFYYTLNTHHIKPLTLHTTSNYDIQDYLLDTLNQQVVICLNTRPNAKSDNVLCFCETDFEGNLKFVRGFPDTLDERFQTARIRQIDTAEYLILGTCQNRKNPSSYHSSSGVYTLRIKDNRFIVLKLYRFENAKPYVSDAMFNNDINYLVGDIVQNQDQFSIIVESYYPVYQYYPAFSSFYREMYYMERTFAGYCFLYAYVKTFDRKGNLIWEYTFPFDNMQVGNLASHLRLSFFPQQMLFYYLKGTQIVTLLIDKDLNIIEPLRGTSLFPKEEVGQSNDTYYSDLQLTNWYDRNYLLSGRQYFKTKRHGEDNSVFYIQKLKFK